MHGESQSAWQHAVPATDEPVGPRPNLTFRWWH
jgi:alkylated DNA repair dioxygenase AlkB